MPNHEPRGCSRGAQLLLVSVQRQPVKYPMVRGRLLRAVARGAQDARSRWRPGPRSSRTRDKRKSYKSVRGMGGFVRSSWDEVNEIIAAANIHTIKTYGPDRMVGFSPIPAMSMVSYAAGSRYLSLIGGVCMSFYDWYCDLPPASPQTWGEQTDVPESADWYNSTLHHRLGLQRAADAHAGRPLLHRGALQGRQDRRRSRPTTAEVAKLSDLWLRPKPGTDAALAMAMGHVMLKEFYIDKQVPYFQTTPPLHRPADPGELAQASAMRRCRTAACAPPTSTARSARPTIRNGRPLAIDERAARSSCQTARSASAGAKGRPGQVEPASTRMPPTAARSG